MSVIRLQARHKGELLLVDDQGAQRAVPESWLDRPVEDGAELVLLTLETCDGCGRRCCDFQTGLWGRRCVVCVADGNLANADVCVRCQEMPVTLEYAPWCPACVGARGAK